MNTAFDKELEALGVKERFHHNVAAFGDYPKNSKTVSEFICGAFIWDETTEGHAFWSGIDDKTGSLTANEEYPEEYYEYLSTL